jgi:hypothetical protein
VKEITQEVELINNGGLSDSDNEDENPYNDDTSKEKKMTWGRILYPLGKIYYRRDGLAQVYLIRIYFLISLVFIYALLLIIWSPFRNFYFQLENATSSMLFYESWNQRFRIITVSLMTMPFLVSAIYSMFVWPNWNISQNSFDSIYLLKEYKLARQMGKGDRYKTYSYICMLSEK